MTRIAKLAGAILAALVLAVVSYVVAPLNVSAAANLDLASANPSYTNPAPYVMPSGMVHCTPTFEPGSDLKHYAKWILGEVGVPESAQAARYPNGWEMREIDTIWLYLTPDECTQAQGLTGTGPLLAVEAATVVSLPTPVENGGGTLNVAGISGVQYVPTGIARIGTPVDDWGTRNAPSMAGVKVAVIDTGVDARHPDIPHVVGGYNCSQDERGPEGWGQDFHSHGTHVAGTIGAAHNDLFVVGAAPGVAIFDAITFGESGSASSAMVLCALNKALESKAQVISASLGGSHPAVRCGGGSVYTSGWCKAARRAIVVVAAGNEAVDAVTRGPANVPGVLTVGAVVDFDGKPGGEAIGFPGCGLGHRDDVLAIFSNYGYETVDVVAPGGCILSTTPQNGWAYMSGTSMATPTVSGVIANFLARYPGCEGDRAVKAVLGYAERFELDYEGWPGSPKFAPPMIRYVLPDQDIRDDNPCKIPREATS